MSKTFGFLVARQREGADRVIERLKIAFELIGSNPGIGHRRQDFTTESVLFWPVGKYLVIYRQNQTGVEVLAVVHGARNIPSFLKKRKAISAT